MVRIKNLTPKFEEPGCGVDVILDNGRILFVDVYEFLDFVTKRDTELFKWLCKQKQISSATEEMKYIYELGVSFEEIMEELIQRKELEFPGWLHENSYRIIEGEEDDMW